MRKSREDKPPPGGWLSPPPTEGIEPLAIARKSKNGVWKWEPVTQTKKGKTLRAEWQRRMDKADAQGKWRFKWPPKEEK